MVKVEADWDSDCKECVREWIWDIKTAWVSGPR